MILSIIIPHYRNINNLKKCISYVETLISRCKFQNLIEVVVVDDGSNQKNILKQVKLKKNFYIYILKKNNGPGIARNFGIGKSIGKYLLFLDCDDFLKLDSLNKFEKILHKNYDIIFYNWINVNNKKKSKPQRKDFKFFKLNKNSLIKKYLSMQMETSVIFSIFNREFINKNKIKFPKGIHEDIFFMFVSYFFSKKIFYLDKVIYIKKNSNNSIINNFNIDHIFFYLLSWKQIKAFMVKSFNKRFFHKNFEKDFISGLAGLIAILVLKNCLFKDTIKNKIKKYSYLNKCICKNFMSYLPKLILLKKSNYDKICSSYICNMLIKNLLNAVSFKEIINWEKRLLHEINISNYKKKFKRT